jgi:hypothetical protein
VFEDRLLRKIGRKRDEVTGDWRTLHNEDLYDLFSSLNIRVIKLGRMKWAGHVACTGEKRCAESLPEGKRPLGRPGHRWGIILQWIFKKWYVEALTGLVWLGIGTGRGLLRMR